MDTQTKNKIPENIAALLIMVPVWDTNVWEPLQKKEYGKAMEKFYSLLGFYTRSTIRKIAWKDILEGSERVRGNISLDEWRINVLPYLGAIILDITDQDFFEYIYSTLESETLFFFHAAIISQVPGETAEEKLAYVTGKRDWLGDFFLASPLGVVFNGFLLASSESIPKFNLDEILDRINNLPTGLRSPFFSSSYASSIKNFCLRNKLEKQEITNIASLVGSVLLGFIPKEKFFESAQETLQENLTGNSGNFLNEFYQTFISFYEEEIQELKDSIESIITENERVLAVQEESEEKEESIKINKVSFPKPEAPEIPKRDETAPLILHKEDLDRITPPSEQTSVFAKGFSPFGFFKKREVKPKAFVPQAPTPPAPVTAPKLIPEPTLPAKNTASIFERIREEKETKKTITMPRMLEIKIEEAPQEKTPGTAQKTVHYSTYKTDIPATTTEGK